jgi:hypothetical protein
MVPGQLGIALNRAFNTTFPKCVGLINGLLHLKSLAIKSESFLK